MKIDLVVTYLDSRKENWLDGYKRYKEEEIARGIQEEENRQAFGSERIRDWDTFRYFLRGVEKNLEWINRVIVVVYDEMQIPEWINRENKKLRVVCHRDYMPKSILPTYNGIAAKFYVSNIKGLSEKYIISDDDYYFINKVEKEMFFRENKTVQIDKVLEYKPFNEKYLRASDGVFYSMLNNNLRFEEKYMRDEKVKYGISHLPEARDKLMEKEIIKDNYELFKEPFKKSKFRHKDQYTSDIFPDILRINKECVLSKDFKNYCKYVTLKSDVDFSLYKDCKIVCFNDTEQLDDFYITKDKLIKFLESKLPNKSSFEK